MLSDENGFTFVELIIVLIILTILITSVSVYFNSLQEQIKASACRANQLGLIQAQNIYFTHYSLNESEGKYAEELDDLIPFINDKRIPQCPSQGSYIIEKNGNVTCSIPEHKRIN
ncbi:MAG: prepilin-type N-terminal cleavage/methylation domain-containing protein [bacterium]